MAKTVRMTTAQAIVKFLDNSMISMDGVETKFVEGFFTIFGHGIAVGLGEALDTNPGQLKVLQGRMSRVCVTLLPLLQNRATAKRSLHVLPPSDLELQTW